ncbi:P-type DNA transfer protein VirB5 [Xanthomonas albilineans]|uniref:Putative type iv secretion system protein n=1 Tax=Xanthomonas albilineans (strain GPE PC73 / CFBP 7063) TaxID=380358 RepID=D6CKB6_XANAP|nr:P-type DNA transfer protein VirB5 [Xanthomonas albilineans]CAZ15905.1 putative type iv secretion system protein [Xanthomonas albilineans]
MKIKLLAVVLTAVCAVFCASTASAQVTVSNVNDFPNMITKASWQAANIAKYAQQVEALEQQLQQMKDQYASLTGQRGLGEILNDPSMSQFVPNQWQSLYSGIKSGNLQGITGALEQVNKDNSGSVASMNAALLQRQQQTAGVDEGLAMKAYDSNIERMKNIQSLLQQINGTQDMKAAADLGNRIAAEQAMVNNEHAKLQLVAMMEQAEKQAQQAQGNAIWNKQMTQTDNLPRLPDNLQAQQ